MSDREVYQDETVERGNDRKKKRTTKRRCCCSRLTCLLITGLIVCCASLIVSVGSGVSYAYKEDLLYYIANKMLSLTGGSLMTNQWVHLSPDEIAIYYFNITNPYEIQHEGAQPIVEEVGPFNYMKKRLITNLFWNQDQSLLSFSCQVFYHDTNFSSSYDPKKITVTTLNVPLIGLLQLIENIESKYKDWKLILRTIFKTEDWINEILNYEPLFITKTVDELCWGYEDPIFKLVHELDPSLLPNANFSLQSRYKMFLNNTINTGKLNSTLRGQFVVWNGLSELPHWNTPTARTLIGTDAVVFHTNISHSDVLHAFTNEFQRSISFTYNKDELFDGIHTYRFDVPMQELNSSLMDPGFYPDGPSGVFNLSAIEPFNIPLFASKPHFLDADPGFVKNITGLSPNRSLHDSFCNVEPITGITVRGAKRIQINIQIKQNKQFVQLKHLRKVTLLPIFYEVDANSINDNQAGKLHNTLSYVHDSFNIGLPVLVALTGLLFLLTVICQLVIVVQMRGKCFNNVKNKQRREERTLPALNEQTPLLQ